MKENMRKLLRIIWKPLIGVAGLAVLIIWTTGAFTDRVEPGVEEYTPGLALPADAERVPVRIASVPHLVDTVGTVASDHAVPLSPRISAAIEEVLVSAGDRVTRDQVVIRLADRDLRAALNDARASLRRAETEYERIKRLHEKEAATEQQLIAAESAFRSAESRVDEAETMLSYTEIRAPMDGMVGDRHAEAGMLAQPGQTLLSLYDPTVMRLDAAVPVRLVDYLAIGDTLRVQLERPDRVVDGRVHRVVSEIDPRSRTQTIQVMLDLDEAAVLPGTFGRLRIPTTERERHLVPTTAVYRVGQLELVQVVTDERAIRRLVKTGQTLNDEIEVLSGLQEGDEVLVRPMK